MRYPKKINLMLWHKIVVIGCIVLLNGCQHQPSSSLTQENNDIRLTRLVQSDIDEVIALHQQAVLQQLQEMMLKLYRRNPSQRYDKDRRTIEESVTEVFLRPVEYGYSHWEGLSGVEMIQLAMDPNYGVNDRILPFILGLRKMIMASYNHQHEFHLFNKVDEQKLYNSARNIEVAAWLLAQRKDNNNQALILSDSVAGEQRNISYQRIIGKMIATQDNLAKVVSRQRGRVIKAVVLQVASMAFLPI